jgi:class 3 adenylate cyclase
MYMDVHPGLGDATAEEVTAAHQRDLAVQDKYGVKFLTYFYNNPEGKAFCLADAPDPEAMRACHQEAHGLMPNEIMPVDAPTLGMFLGDWARNIPDQAFVDGPGSEPDTGLRAIVFTDIEGSTHMSTSRGDDAAMEAVRTHDEIVRESLSDTGGREIKHTGDGILASFTSVTRAVQATIDVQQRTEPILDLAIKIGISAGEPVDGSNDIYGAAVNLAARICSHANGGQTLAAGTIRDLAIGKSFEFVDQGVIALKGFPESVRLYEVR